MTITQQQRQKQLFAAEDWQVVYTAFTQVNFNAYDFNTIRDAMVNYIRLNYPEDFNDWIESSEFVAIIDLLSYVGTSLAFRMDLNTRENFLDTAQRRESIFRLARMLSYQPQRCITSTGLIKVTQVVSNQDIFDSNGRNIKNIPVNWNDQNNPDWYEQFILVVNSSMNNNNHFGNPSKSGIINGIDTQLYSMNNQIIPSSTVPFTATVSGFSMNFELVNPDFISQSDLASQLGVTGHFVERDPNPVNDWNLIYRADGNGYSSADTGFFLMFKQGNMSHADFKLDLPLANRILDINANDINQTDVWVQSIDANGLVTKTWTKVPGVNGFNVIYNSVDKSIRDIFSVITRDSSGNDQISIRFADGNFGNVPTGLIRVWYRTSNNLQYQIRPSDMVNLKFNFAYNDQLDNTYSLAFNTALQYTVANSQARETNEQIKLNASQVYYTQDRMVNGEDYNLYPLQSSQALKVKAVNRFYAGQSRYLDINDPTGAYQNTTILGQDGLLYSETSFNRQEFAITTSINPALLTSTYVQPILNGDDGMQNTSTELRDFFYSNYPTQLPVGMTWSLTTTSTNSSTGSFFVDTTAVQIGLAATIGTPANAIKPLSMVKFKNYGWASVVSIIGDGTGVNSTGVLSSGQGAVILAGAVTQGDPLLGIYPPFKTTLTGAETDSISAAFAKKQTFGLRYDAVTTAWIVVTSDNISNSTTFSLANAGDTSSTGADASWLLRIAYTGTSWIIQTRSKRYVFESENDVRFYFANNSKVINQTSQSVAYDSINVLGVNTQSVTPYPLGQDYYWKIRGQEIYPDGYAEPRSIRVTFWETMQAGIPDNPEEFIAIADPNNSIGTFLFWERYTSTDGYQYFQPINISLSRIYGSLATVPPATNQGWTEGTMAFVTSPITFLRWTGGQLVDVTADHKVRIGRKNLKFVWKHYAPYDQLIDPAINNLIDVYVLTASYDTAIRNWLTTNGTLSDLPTPPTTDQLRITFGYFEQFKMMTDQIIWHPVTYKVLFGSLAAPELQVIFKVVKISGTTMGDNEVKSLVKAQIDAYFELQNWDFGQSFFFTELATYIHMNLATIVASVVLVPKSGNSKFGDLFEIVANPDEIFISGAAVTDIMIVNSITEAQLGITHG
jgi:hypothetical protein